MIDLERYYHLEREYLFMDTKEKTADWSIPDENDNIQVPDELAPLFNKVATQLRFHTISGKSEVITVAHIVQHAAEYAEAYAEQKLSALQAGQKPMKWVKATDRLPLHQLQVPIKLHGMPYAGRYDYSLKRFICPNLSPTGIPIDGVEWLDEDAPKQEEQSSPAKEVEKPDFEGHTPGPWKVYTSFYTPGNYGVNNGKDTSSIVGFDGLYGDTPEERLANAKLIAAAPDLLKENRFLYSQIKELKEQLEKPEVPIDKENFSRQDVKNLMEVARTPLLKENQSLKDRVKELEFSCKSIEGAYMAAEKHNEILKEKAESLEAENEELRKKINDDIDRELRDHGMKSLPSKPEN